MKKMHGYLYQEDQRCPEKKKKKKNIAQSPEKQKKTNESGKLHHFMKDREQFLSSIKMHKEPSLRLEQTD